MNQGVFAIYTDGGSRGNPGPGAVAFVVKNKEGKILFQRGKYIGKTTNNVAEYVAIIEALNWIKQNYQITKLPNDQIVFFLDSQLVVNQLNGYFKIKDSKLRNLIIKVRRIEAEVGKPIQYRFIPRRLNKSADLLVNRVLDKVKG